MEPLPKRTRLFAEEVEDDGESPLSLFHLSLNEMIANAQNGVCPIETHKISPLVTDQIWKESSLLDIIKNLCNSSTFDLFSNRVVKPPSFTVSNWRATAGIGEEIEHCELSLEFDDGRTLEWKLSRLSPMLHITWLNEQNSMLSFQVGNQAISTEILEETEKYLSLESDLTDLWSSRLEIIEWFTKAFNCKIDTICLWDDLTNLINFNDLINWDQLKTVPNLIIDECSYPDLLQTFWPVRVERKLRTHFTTLNCPQPVQFRLTRTLQFSYIHMNLSSLSIEELGTYMRKALKVCSEGAEFNIPKLNSQQVQKFKTEDDTPERINLLKENYEISSKSKEIFKTLEPAFYNERNSKVFVYYFLEESPGVYDRLLGHYWEAKQGRVP